MRILHSVGGISLLMLLSACASRSYRLVNIERSRIIVDSRYDQHPDESASAFLAPYKQVNDSIMSPIVGRVARNMHVQKPESDLSNLLADILVWAAKDYNEQPVLGVYNMGGIRADLTKGDVTYEHVLSVAPFENKICFVTLTGEQLLLLFEQMAARGGEGVSKGAELVIAKRDGRWKLLSARLNGEEIDAKRTYRVTTIDYLLEGNDGMPAFTLGSDKVAPKETSNNSRFIIMNYFRDKMARGETVDAKVEGRIRVKSEQ